MVVPLVRKVRDSWKSGGKNYQESNDQVSLERSQLREEEADGVRRTWRQENIRREKLQESRHTAHR